MPEARELPASAAAVWAKTFWDDDQRIAGWLPLWQHLDDAAGVAGLLWDHWVPRAVRDLVAGEFGGDEDLARAGLTFLAGAHDVGKASPAFAVQAKGMFVELLDGMRLAGLPVPREIAERERRRLRHELAGHVALWDWLRTTGTESPAATALAVVIGGHHGLPPDITQPRQALRRPDLLGDGAWAEARLALLDRAAAAPGVRDALASVTATPIGLPAQVLLTALVIVADWIASDIALFPLVPLGTEPGPDPLRLQRGWDALALPPPWQPAPGAADVGDRLRSRFALPDGAHARPVQEAAVAAALEVDLPGILVIEAPMGEGKTEAALLAAEVLAARSGAGGCFVALPTQATTDAMFERVLGWLERLPDAGRQASGGTDAGAHSVSLLHGKAWLSDAWRELRFRRPPTGIAQDDHAPGVAVGAGEREVSVQAFVHGWTSGRKRRVLADFSVGTVDQVLFAALKAKHVVLRHLGLARTVVVVDEVHAYDTYMNSYLLRAMEWLGAYGTPVVLLSATLPAARRDELFAAYAKGRGEAVVPGLPTAPGSYPVVTARTAGTVQPRQLPASGRRARVELEVLDDGPDDDPTGDARLAALLADRLVDGGCALVVRNTVTRAQRTATALHAVFGDDVRLVHARYLGHHRLANDAWLRAAFGPPGRAGDRPRRAVVVGTQVVEQSLDVDFDLLVSDLAPMDLLLQRIGRLHRHVRGQGEQDRPAALRAARCVVAGVGDWSADPVRPARGSVSVYGSHLLLRSAAEVRERVGEGRAVALPDDIAGLVERNYGEEPVGPASWQATMDAARQTAAQRAAARRAAADIFQVPAPVGGRGDLLGWLHADIGEADDDPRSPGRAEVRDGDDSVEVLLLHPGEGPTVRLPTGDFQHAGDLVPTDRAPRRDLVRAVAGCTLRLPASLTRGDTGTAVLTALEQHWFPAWQQVPELRGQLLLLVEPDPGGPDGPGWTQLPGVRVRYRSDTGLEVSHDA